MAHAVKGWVLGVTGTCIFFQAIPVQLLKLCLITVVLFMCNTRYVFLIKPSHRDAVYFD